MEILDSSFKVHKLQKAHCAVPTYIPYTVKPWREITVLHSTRRARHRGRRSVSSGRRKSSRQLYERKSLSGTFFYPHQSGGLFRARVRRQPPSRAPRATPALSLSAERSEALPPTNRDHRRCASKLDDLVKSKTPDASIAERWSRCAPEKMNPAESKLIFTDLVARYPFIRFHAASALCAVGISQFPFSSAFRRAPAWTWGIFR